MKPTRTLAGLVVVALALAGCTAGTSQPTPTTVPSSTQIDVVTPAPPSAPASTATSLTPPSPAPAELARATLSERGIENRRVAGAVLDEHRPAWAVAACSGEPGSTMTFRLDVDARQTAAGEVSCNGEETTYSGIFAGVTGRHDVQVTIVGTTGTVTRGYVIVAPEPR